MHMARVTLSAAVLLLGVGTAAAQGSDRSLGALVGQPSYAGLKDLSEIPAPIPVPSARPIPEGFSYYLRIDGGYGMQGQGPSFSERGRTYGAGGTPPFTGTPTFAYNGAGFSGINNDTIDVGFGGVGFGAYFTPWLRADATLEFRTARGTDVTGTYSYTSAAVGNPTVNGTMRDHLRTTSTVALLNAYIDMLPRGRFSPYVGAGVGMAYHQIDRDYYARETAPGNTLEIMGSHGVGRTTFAAALMAGATFAIDHRWALDLNYRALYMQGGSVSITTTGLASNQVSTATLGDSWEHQVRLGLRLNIW